MKVYVHYEEGSDAELHVTLKLTLPKKWNDESPMKLLQVHSSEVSAVHRCPTTRNTKPSSIARPTAGCTTLLSVLRGDRNGEEVAFS